MQSPLTPEGIAALRGASQAGGAYQDRKLRASKMAQDAYLRQQELDQQDQQFQQSRDDLAAHRQAEQDRHAADRAMAVEQFRQSLDLEKQYQNYLINKDEKARAISDRQLEMDQKQQLRDIAIDRANRKRSTLPASIQQGLGQYINDARSSQVYDLGAEATSRLIGTLGPEDARKHIIKQLMAAYQGMPNGPVPNAQTHLDNIVATNPDILGRQIFGMPGLFQQVDSVMDGDPSALKISIAGELAGTSVLGNQGALAAVMSGTQQIGSSLFGYNVEGKAFSGIETIPGSMGWMDWLYQGLQHGSGMTLAKGFMGYGYGAHTLGSLSEQGYGGSRPGGRGIGNAQSWQLLMSNQDAWAEKQHETDRAAGGSLGEVDPNLLSEGRVVIGSNESRMGQYTSDAESMANWILHGFVGGAAPGDRPGEAMPRVGQALVGDFTKMHNNNLSGSGRRAITSDQRKHLINLQENITASMVYDYWDNGGTADGYAQMQDRIKVLIQSSPYPDLTTQYLSYLHDQFSGFSEAFKADKGGVSGMGHRIKDGEDTEFMKKQEEAFNAQLREQGIDPESTEGQKEKRRQRERLSGRNKIFDQVDGHVAGVFDMVVSALDPHVITQEKMSDMASAMYVGYTAMGFKNEWNQIRTIEDPGVRRIAARELLARNLDQSMQGLDDFMIENSEVSSSKVKRWGELRNDQANLMDAARRPHEGEMGPPQPVQLMRPQITGEDVVELAERLNHLQREGKQIPPELTNAMNNPIMRTQVNTARQFLTQMDYQDAEHRANELGDKYIDWAQGIQAEEDALLNRMFDEREDEAKEMLKLIQSQQKP